MAVHQTCYDVLTIPDDEWYCDPCAAAKKRAEGATAGAATKPKPPKCGLCHQKKGALKKTSCGNWAHLTCILWIPELYFSQDLQPGSLANLDRGRASYSCEFCSLGGGVRLCEMPNCNSGTHISCGKNAQLRFEEYDEDGTYQGWIFCSLHSRDQFAAQRAQVRRKIAQVLRDVADGKTPPEPAGNPSLRKFAGADYLPPQEKEVRRKAIRKGSKKAMCAYGIEEVTVRSDGEASDDESVGSNDLYVPSFLPFRSFPFLSFPFLP